MGFDLHFASGFQFYSVHSCSFFQHVMREGVDVIFDLVPLDEALRWSLGLGLEEFFVFDSKSEKGYG